MHAQRIDSCTHDVDGQTEAAVMMLLLSTEHCPWSRAELEREVSRPSGNPIDVTDALDRLHASGLVHVWGELVMPSWAARRLDELTL